MSPNPWTVEVVVGRKRTAGAYAVLDVRMPGGLAVPPHVNRHEDILVLVLTGAVELVLDGRWLRLEPGGHRLVPRDLPRRLSVLEDAHLLLVAVPAGLDQLEELANDASVSADDRAALLAVAGIDGVPATW